MTPGDATPITANDLLTSSIAAQLGGDRRRVVELFQDRSLHARLAALPADGWLNYRDASADGLYFVEREGVYAVYSRERGSVSYDFQQFLRISDAAAYFFSIARFTAPDDADAPAVAPKPAAPPSPPSRLDRAMNTIGALMLGVLGLAFFGIGSLMVWATWEARPELLSGPLLAVLGMLCLVGSYRSHRRGSWFGARWKECMPERAQFSATDTMEIAAQWRQPSKHADPRARDWALQRCSGFLDAIALWNSDGACMHRYFLTPLPPAPDLHDALTLHFEEQLDDDTVDAWAMDTQVVEAPKAYLLPICEKWFFRTQAGGLSMPSAPGDDQRSILIAEFLDKLGQAIGKESAAYSVSVRLPAWYASEWDLIAFEYADRRFLLMFCCPAHAA